MDGWSACMIDTRIVYGFPGAGKTSYIRDCIRNDFFYKYGTTLILCFERGAEEYDAEELIQRNARVVYYEGRKDIGEFCLDPIRKYHPDRIYVEMNVKLPGLRRRLPEEIHVIGAVTLIDWSSIESFLTGEKQIIRQMVSESQQITFRGCPSKELLLPYSQEFQLMNRKASYLRQDPMGYHEKAFDLFLPYSLEKERIPIPEKDYLVFWLDASEHPEHYEGKLLCFPDPLEIRQTPEEEGWSAGRVVMTCCMADLQFMSFELTGSEGEALRGGWITLEAVGRMTKDSYGQKKLKLEPKVLTYTAVPQSGMILQSRPGAGTSGAVSELSAAMFQRLSKGT